MITTVISKGNAIKPPNRSHYLRDSSLVSIVTLLKTAFTQGVVAYLFEAQICILVSSGISAGKMRMGIVLTGY